MKGITYCGACADYDCKKHRCRRGASLESRPQDKFYDDCPLADAVPVVRCRDCRKMKTYECPMQSCGYDDFCSYGERRESNADR